MEIEGRNILITGASGFIGSRLCEKLYLGHSAKIIGIVRNMGRASRIGRLGINIVRCDIFEKSRIKELIKQADIVVHLAAGDARTIVEGTRLVAKYSRKCGIKKLIHMSTAAVYGIQSNESHTTEEAPLKKTGNPYSDAKLMAEKIIQKEIMNGLNCVILRPRIVYGPYSFWVMNIFSAIISDKFVLVDDGAGACNTVYIDNLIDAVVLSIENDKAKNHTFFITDDERITWGRFYKAFLAMTGRNISFENVDSSAFNLSKPGSIKNFAQEINNFFVSRAMRDFIKEAPIINMAMRPLFSYLYTLPYETKLKIKDFLGIYREEKNIAAPNKLLSVFDQPRLMRESGTGFTCLNKAKKILQYTPKIDFSAGSELTKEWLKFARII